MAFFNVPNFSVKVLFLTEIRGQISDGQWENAYPFNHCDFWCSIESEDIGIAPDNIGREDDFHDSYKCVKDGYGLTRKTFLDGIWERMVESVKLYNFYRTIFGEEKCFDLKLPSSMEQVTLWYKIASKGEKPYVNRYVNRVEFLERNNIGIEKLREVCLEDTYFFADLKKDLSLLNKAMRTLRK